MADTLPGIVPAGMGEWIRMGIYSYPGWGKTSVIGTSAYAGRVLVIKSSLDLMPSRVLKQNNVDTFTADTHEKMLEVLDYCRMAQDFPYLWVWWDCVSIAQDVLLDDVWEAAALNNPKRAWIFENGVQTSKPNINSTGGKDRPEYWTNADRMQMWVRHMIGVNRFHFGMSFHPSEGPHPTNDEGGTVLRPWVQVKNMPEKFCGYCNMVGFLEVIEGDDDQPNWRRLHFKENARFYAKDQYDAFLPKGYIDITESSKPTIPRIMEAVEKARGKPLGTVRRTTAAPATRGRGRGAAPATTSAGRGRGR